MPPPITLKSPLPAADLLFESMTSSAGLSSLGETQLNLLSPKPDLKPEDLLGKSVTVTVQLRDDAKRHFNGFVSRFGAGQHRGRYFALPGDGQSLALVPDAHLGLPHLPGPDRPRHRQEGVRGPRHRQVRVQDLPHATASGSIACSTARATSTSSRACSSTRASTGTSSTATASTSSSSSIRRARTTRRSRASRCLTSSRAPTPAPDTDCVSDWRFSQEVRTGKVALTSYDFERPSTDLKVDALKERKYTMSDYEVFDFHGDYIQKSDGKQLAEDRMDELQTPFQALHGASNAQGIEVGRLLKLTKHPRADQNAQYLITALHVSAHVDAYESGNAAGDFRCDFSAIPAAQQFRPTRRTPKPFVQGPQTAVVVGPARRGDLHRQVRPREGAVPLGPLRQEEREELVLGARLASVGRQELGRRAHAAHRPGGRRRLPRRRPRPADHHRPRLQRRADAALGPAGQRDAERAS